MSSVRLRRLTADYASLEDYIRRHPRMRMIQADGDPPERYQLEYRVKSLRKKDDEFRLAKTHNVEIALPRNYPRTPPLCRMLTPVFHPNIAPHAICVGDHWSAGESLESIVIRIGEMLAYQVYNVKSPLNGDAARWVQENEHKLPLDEVSMLAEDPEYGEEYEEYNDGYDGSESEAVPDATPVSHPASPPVPKARKPAASPSRSTATEKSTAASATGDTVVVNCHQCSRRYRVSVTLIGKKAKCQQCGTQFSIQPHEV